MRWVPMLVEGVAHCGCSARHPVLAMREQDGHGWLNVRLGCQEAKHLAGELAGSRMRSSVTYRLIEEMLSALGWEVARVRLRLEDDGDMFSLVELSDGARRAGVRAHPGDAVVVAARALLPVEVPESIVRTDPRGALGAWFARHQEGALDDFRRFLDGVEPRDFAG